MMLFISLAAENKHVIHVDGHYPFVNELLKMSFIIVWKVVGLIIKLKNITKGSKRPWFILNRV